MTARPAGRIVAVARGALLAGLAAGCRTPAAAPVVPPRHLVLVTIDTLRADRLGVYGNHEIATPSLDAIAREGAFALEATAHVPLTRPSHVSLFTGRLPYETGVRDNVSPAVVPETPLLAEVLKGAGFQTGAFVSSIVLDPSSGLDRGFDVYDARFEGRASEAQFLSTLQKKGDVTTRAAVAWLESVVRAGAEAPRTFLWLHLYDPHDPYEPPEPYATRYAGRLYDGEVAFADELVGRLDQTLARLGLRDQTLLVVTADHGEGLGEHGEALHGFFTYQTTLRIPFLVRGPSVRPGGRLAATARLVDVFPTVLDLLAVPAPAAAHFAGRSLAPALRGDGRLAEPVSYAESLVPLLHFGWSDLRVIREGRYKYIQAPRPELFDLATDPGETKNLAAAEPSRAEAMRAALGRTLEAERRQAEGASGGAAVPTELLEKLGALGYVGAGGAAETRTPGADPKDKVEEFRFANDQIREGLLRFHAKDYAASVAHFEAVQKRGISSFEVHFYLARGLLALGRVPEAAQHFEEATARAPAHAEAWEGLKDARLQARDPQGALEALHRGEKALPADASLRIAEGKVLRDLGRGAAARQVLESALALAPRNAALRMYLGELLREQGVLDEAAKRQREAADLEPKNASYWNSLGMTLGGSQKFAEAETCFREAVRLDDADHRYAFNLGLSVLRQGRPADARPYFEKALARNPGFTPARDELLALDRAARATRP